MQTTFGQLIGGQLFEVGGQTYVKLQSPMIPEPGSMYNCVTLGYGNGTFYEFPDTTPV